MAAVRNPNHDSRLDWIAYLTWTAVCIERFAVRGWSERMAWFGLFMLVFLWAMWRHMREGEHIQWPQWLLALSAPGVMVMGAGGGAAAMVVMAAAQLAYTGEGRRQWLQIGLMNLLLLAGMGWFWSWRDALANFPIFAGFQGFAVLCMRFARRSELAAETLRTVNASLLATRSLLEASARDQERLRLSRELHDIAGHKLTALRINLEVWRRAHPETASAEIDTAIAVSAELLRDIRGVVAQLRAHDGIDLAQSLRTLAAQWPRPQVQLELDPQLRIGSLAQAETLLRVAQEGITNAARHGQASKVRLRLNLSESGELKLEIEDDGRGCPAQLQIGNGLRGMRERLDALGGTLDIGAASPHGMRLTASLPEHPA